MCKNNRRIQDITIDKLYNVNEKQNKIKKHFKIGNLYLVKNDQKIIGKIEYLCEKENAKKIKFLCYKIENIDVIDSFIDKNKYDIIIINNWNETNQNTDDVKTQAMELKIIAKRKQIPIIINAENYQILWDYCHWYLEMDPVTEHISFKG